MVQARFINDTNTVDVRTQETPHTVNVFSTDGIKEHNLLDNRDLADQHPMSAITGLESSLESKQDILTAGDNVQIENNVISATDTTYTAGTGISIENGVISNTQTSAEWGNITGTITNQTDLKNALDTKADISDIPTVNNATLTIQENNTGIGTFTANSSSDTTINITVPTKASDVNALPNSTKYGASLTLSINSSTYVVTAQLKDQDGNNLGSAQSIDLPLENVVVSGSYDDETKKIILTLQNGSTIEFSVADLVSGLQTEITSSNKLSADLVDDTNTTNKFVTSSDISTWNAKQNALTAGTGIDITSDTISNSGVRSVSTGATNGTISVNTNGTSAEVAVYGLGSAAYTASTAYDVSGSASTAETNAKNYADSLASNYATAAQGALADTAVQPADISNMVTTDTVQNITGTKTFVGQKKVGFKQSSSSDKLGFTLYDNNNVEKGYLEFNPSNLVDNAPLMTLGNYASASAGITHVGFRKYSSISGENGAYNLLAPLVKDAKTPFSLTTTYTNFYLPLGFTDGTDTVTTSKSGVVDFSTLLTKKQDTLVSGTNIKTINNSSILGSGNIDIDSLPSQTGQSGKFLTTNGTTASWGTPAGATYTAGTGIDITSNVISVDGISTSEVTLATVATSGSYNDLSNKPTIPAAQVNSDWNANSGVAQILNKPNILTSVDSSSTNNDTVGAKLFYDTCGDIETLINAL